jgi:hypothetical protein
MKEYIIIPYIIRIQCEQQFYLEGKQYTFLKEYFPISMIKLGNNKSIQCSFNNECNFVIFFQACNACKGFIN